MPKPKTAPTAPKPRKASGPPAEPTPIELDDAARRAIEEWPRLRPEAAIAFAAELAEKREADKLRKVWTKYTPDPMLYFLIMEDSDGQRPQDVELTRPEFIALKKHLAQLRDLEWSKDAEDEA